MAKKSFNTLGLPLPRLQLTWERVSKCEWLCKYELLIPLPEHDIRNEKGLGYLAASLGGTKVTKGEDRTPMMMDGVLDTPFRDGAHANWDSISLGMPAFVVWEDNFRRLDKSPAQWPPVRDDSPAQREVSK